MKRFRIFFLIAAALCLSLSVSACASSRRLARINGEQALQRKNSIDGNAVNLWPFFLAGKDYFSVLWPFIDWDKHGFSIRPIMNKEYDEWAFLFPLAGFNPDDRNGWCGIAYWNVPEKYCGLVPLFHYSADKRDLNYYGPIWYVDKKGGLFPIVWKLDDFACVFPLVAITDDACYSIPFSTLGGQTPGLILNWSKKKDFPGYFYTAGKYRWYNSFGIFGGGWKTYYHIGQYDPLAFYAKNCDNNRYHFGANLRKFQLKHDVSKILFREDIHANFWHDYIMKQVKPQKNCWWYAFPFADYESYGNDWILRVLFGFGMNLRRTEGLSETDILPLLYFQQQKSAEKEKFLVDRSTSGYLYTPFFQTSEKQYYRMHPEKSFFYEAINPEHLALRPYLCFKESIKNWEEDFQRSSRHISRETYVSKKGYSRKIYRTAIVPMPKTAEDAEKLLNEIKSPANYDLVNEKSRGVFPFYKTSEKTYGRNQEKYHGILCGLLAMYDKKPYSLRMHILGPFGYLRDMEFAEGDFEREKWKNDFRMSLLCYRRTKENYVQTYQAKQQYKGIQDAELRRRMVLTDPQEIKHWEDLFEASVDRESTVAIPKTAKEAEALLKEINAPEHWKKGVSETFGFFPLFHWENGTFRKEFSLLMGLLADSEKSETKEKLSILTPLVFGTETNQNHPKSMPYTHFRNEEKSVLLFSSDSRECWFRKKSASKFSANDYRLIERLRMTNPKVIENWEKGFAISALLDNPSDPAPVPKSAKEAAKRLQETRDLKNYRKFTEQDLRVFPLFRKVTGTDENTLEIPFYSRQQKKNEYESLDLTSVLGSVAYLDRTESRNDGKNTIREKTILLTGTKTETAKHEEPPFPLLHDLANRALMDENDKEKLKEWYRNYNFSYWDRDPAAAFTYPIPATREAARNMLIANQKAPEKTVVTERFRVLGGLYGTDRKSDDSLVSEYLGFKALYQNEQTRSKYWNKDLFHILGPFGYLKKKTESKWHFPCNRSTENEITIALLGSVSEGTRMVPTEEHKRNFRYLGQERNDYRISEIVREDKIKKRNAEELKRYLTRWDGTLAQPVPKNAKEAMQLTLDANRTEGFREVQSKGSSIFPLYFYKTGENAASLILPPLLSGYTREYGKTETDILLGLLYSRETKKRTADFQWLDQLPMIWYSDWKRGKFIDGDHSFETESIDRDSSRIALIFSKTEGHVRAWKKNTPKRMIRLYERLYYLDDLHDKRYREETEKLLTEMKIDHACLKDWRSRQLKRKEIFEKYAEIIPYYERGKLGKILFRYAECDNHAAMWLGYGLLAKYTRELDEENISVLGYLYRSHKNKTASTQLIFPFIKIHEDQQKSSFSFLWRLVNVETAKDGKISGHIFFIPFGG